MAAHILIVHDRVARRAEFKKCLEPQYKVTECGDIPGAMETIKAAEQQHLNQDPFDLIICAVHVDGATSMSVFDLLKWTKGNPQAKDIPFVLLDSEPTEMARYVFDSVRFAGAALGAAGYVELEEIAPREFRRRMEAYLPAHLRCTEPGG